MPTFRTRARAVLLATAIALTGFASLATADDFEAMAHVAPEYRGAAPVLPMDDKNILIEAEEMQVLNAG